MMPLQAEPRACLGRRCAAGSARDWRGDVASLAPEAEGELLEAARRYETRVHGLGDRFLDRVDETLALIAEWPDAYSQIDLPGAAAVIRGASVKRFPYTVVYANLPAEIRVVAVAHQKRRALYWAERLHER